MYDYKSLHHCLHAIEHLILKLFLTNMMLNIPMLVQISNLK